MTKRLKDQALNLFLIRIYFKTFLLFFQKTLIAFRFLSFFLIKRKSI